MNKLKFALVLFCIWGININGFSQNRPFITEWINPSGDIIIPTNASSGPYLYDVKYYKKNDSAATTSTILALTGNYSISGPNFTSATDTIVVEITGTFPHFFMAFDFYNRLKLVSVVQWGDNLWSDFSSAFAGCENLSVLATDTPDLSNVRSMNNMFSFCRNFNLPINHWDVSNITSMNGTFEGCGTFNQSLSNWNMSNVTDIGFMFSSCVVFNQALDNWDVSNVTNMESTFNYSLNFNQPLSSWNIAGVTNMEYIFVYSGMSYCNMDATLNAWAPVLINKNYAIGSVPVASINSKPIRDFLDNRISLVSLEISNPITNTVIINNAPNSVCKGDLISLTTTSTYNSSYNWNKGAALGNSFSFNITQDTNITVIATDSLNCRSYNTVAITALAPALTLTSNATNNETCINNTITFTATGADFYEWNGIVNNANTASYVALNDTIMVVKGNDLTTGCSATDTLEVIALALPSVTLTSDATNDETCLNTTVTFTAAGATTYEWNGVNNNANTASYIALNDTIMIVKGTDSKGCFASDTLEIIVNAIPTVALTSNATSDELCLNTMVQFTATGANTYEWNGVVDAVTISFAITNDTTLIVSGIDANGCSASDTLEFTTLALPIVTLTSDATNDETCFNTVLTFTAIGADTYEWNGVGGPSANNITLQADTIMIVKGTDAITGCSATDTLEVIALALPSVTLTSDATNDETCLNTTVTFTAAGATTYEWNGVVDAATISFAIINDTTLIVSGIDANGCSASDTLEFTALHLPTVTITADTTTICNGNAANLTAAGATTYLWSTLATEEEIAVAPSATTTYTVTGKDTNECENTASVVITVEECVSIDENIISFSVYPNPATEYVIIQTQNVDLSKATIMLLDVTGKVLVNTNIIKSNTIISMANYPAGLYFIKVQAGDGQQIQKVIKR